MGTRVRFGMVLAVLVTAAAAAPVPAHAIGWLSPTLPAGGASEHPAVGMAANGELIVGWNRTIDGKERLQTTVRAPGGQYTVPQTIGGDDVIGADFPRLAVAPDGTAILIWTRPDAVESLHYSVRTPGGAFGPAQSLTDAGTGALATPSITMNAKGDALAFWQRKDAADTLRVWAAVRPAGGSFSAPTAVSPGEGCEPAGAIGDDGSASVAFVADCTTFPTVRLARRQPGGTFAAATEVAPTSDLAADAAVAVDGAGRTAVAWTATSGGTSVVKAAFGPSDGPLTTQGAISAAGQVASGPRLLATPDGSIYAAWTSQATGEQRRVAVAKRANGGTGFAPPVSVSDPASKATDPVLEAMNDSSVLLVWLRDGRLESASRGADSAFGQILTLSPEGAGAPLLAVDGNGNGAVVYDRSEGGAVQVHVQGYDAVAPKPGSISLQTVAVRGQPVTVEASGFTDVWGVKDGTIDFGDGFVAPGLKATHAYATAGARQIGTVVNDFAGNSIKVFGTIAVIASPADDRTPPILSDLRLNRPRFRQRQGARILFTLSEPALVNFTVVRFDRGRRVGGSCRAETRSNRRRKYCSRRRVLGVFARAALTGASSFALPRRVGGKTIRPGRHLLTAVALDINNNRSRQKTIGFTVR